MGIERPCQHTLGALSNYISGEAAESLCAEIEAHLVECQDCRVLVDTLKKTIVLYRSATPAELPADVRRRLYQVLNLSDYMVEFDLTGNSSR